MPLRALRRVLAKLLRARLRRLPVHVAIIPDGNRRWARRHGLPVWRGHYEGYRRMREVLDLLWDLGVRYVTVYAMSRENCLKRPAEERRELYKLIAGALGELLEDRRVAGGELGVRVVGDLSLVPDFLREKARLVEEKSGGLSREKVLTIGLCYGGRWEILEAARKARSLEVVDEESFSKLLPAGGVPEPDLVIRTGGEVRISNFLLWHIAYSELYFSPRLWPDFDEVELLRALLDYQARERRFGR